MEQEYIVTIKNKNIEAKHATEAAQKLQQSVDELQVASQMKDDEIVRLQAEVTKAKEKMLILEDELTQMHSLVKGKDAQTDKNKDVQLQSCRKLKKNINETNKKSKSEGPVSMQRSRSSQVTPDKRTNKKSKSEGPVSMERSRSSQVTPDKRDVKTSRTRVSETSQKRSAAPYQMLPNDAPYGSCKLKLPSLRCSSRRVSPFQS